jgi:lysyl-tRNA synthetase class II
MNRQDTAGDEITNAAVDENHVIAERRAKLAALRAAGPAFPNDFVPADRAGALLDAHADATREALEQAKVSVSIAGRMVLKRVQGKASFAAGCSCGSTTRASAPRCTRRSSTGTWATSSPPKAPSSAR